MSGHLSPQQISEWAIGERSPDIERHIRGCSLCRGELSRLETALVSFRSSVRRWSDEQRGLDNRTASKNKGHFFFWSVSNAVYCAALAALLCVFISFAEHRNRERQLLMTETTDTKLLEQIDMDVSREVPGPMEPLVRLISWDESSGTPGLVKLQQRMQ